MKQKLVHIYIVLVSLAGLSVFLLASTRVIDKLDWHIGLLLLFSVALDMLPFPLATGVELSVAFMADLVALSLFGPEAGIVIGGLTAAIRLPFRRQPLHRSLFSAFGIVLSTGAGAFLYGLLGGSGGGAPRSPDLIPLLVAAVAISFVNSVLVAGAVALSSGRRTGEVWLQNFAWIVPAYAAITPVVWGMAYLFFQLGAAGLIPALWPLLLARWILKEYVGLFHMHEKMLDVLVSALEVRDPFVMGHARRVAKYCRALGRAAGLVPWRLRQLESAALLHAVGDTEAEWQQHIHSAAFADLDPLLASAERAARMAGEVGPFRGSAEIIRNYPIPFERSVSGRDGVRNELPLESRVLSIAHTFDVLIVTNPGRQALSVGEALQVIQRDAGHRFDPRLVKLFAGLAKTWQAPDSAEARRDAAVAIDTMLDPPTDGALPHSVVLHLQNSQLRQSLEQAVVGIADARAFLQEIVDSTRVGIITVDFQGRVTLVNRAAEQLMGTMAVEALGRKVNEVLPPSFDTGGLWWALRTGGIKSEWRTVLERPGAESLPVVASASLIHNNANEQRGGLLVFWDISRISQLEAQRRRAARLAGFGQMAAALTHQIRTPLTVIRGMAEGLSMNPGASVDAHSAARSIMSEVDRLDELLRGSLAGLTRSLKARRQSVLLQDMLAELVRAFRSESERIGVGVRLHARPEVGPVAADAEMLRHAFLNLIRNALDAMPNGGRLVIAIRRDRNTCRYEGTWAEVRITDTGGGLSKAVEERLFEPFHTTKVGGTGLGLPIAARIISEHGGTIWARSRSGKGTTFIVRLPMQTAVCDPFSG